MVKVAGQGIMNDESTTTANDGTGAHGEALAVVGEDKTSSALDDGTTVQALAGVVSHNSDLEADRSDGDSVSMLTDGIVVAKVAAGVTGGTLVGPSATEGELASGGSAALTMSDEGGSYKGESIPAGFAAVELRI